MNGLTVLGMIALFAIGYVAFLSLWPARRPLTRPARTSSPRCARGSNRPLSAGPRGRQGERVIIRGGR